MVDRPYFHVSTYELGLLADRHPLDEHRIGVLLHELRHRDRPAARRLAKRLQSRLVQLKGARRRDYVRRTPAQGTVLKDVVEVGDGVHLSNGVFVSVTSGEVPPFPGATPVQDRHVLGSNLIGARISEPVELANGDLREVVAILKREVSVGTLSSSIDAASQTNSGSAASSQVTLPPSPPSQQTSSSSPHASPPPRPERPGSLVARVLRFVLRRPPPARPP